MLHRRLRNALAVLFLLALAAPVLAQGHVRAMGMGGAGTAAARGLAAVDWNPANLVMSRDGGVRVGLASVAVDVHNNSFSLDRYNQVTGAVLTEADKQILLGDIPEGGLVLDANVRASALGFCVGPFALSLQGIAGGSGTLDKDFFDLILMGNEIGQSFAFDDTEGEASALAAATLSWATPVLTRRTHRLSLGVNARYLHGLYDFRVESAAGGLTADLDGVRGAAEASYLTSRGGSGWALDLGLTLQAPRGWTFGLVLDNAASRMNWDRDVERHLWSAVADSVTASSGDLDDHVTETETTTTGAAYVSDLPGRLRLGASNHLGLLLLAADVALPLEAQAGGSADPEFSLGMEFRLASWFAPRVGAATGGAAGRRTALGLGLGLGPLRWDLAVANHGSWVPESTRGLSFASGFGLAF